MTKFEKLLSGFTALLYLLLLFLPSGGKPLRESPAPPEHPATAVMVGHVDLNQADRDALCTLPGVGEVIAGRIIAWREENGGFLCVEDLRCVEGIGEKTMEKIYEYREES